MIRRISAIVLGFVMIVSASAVKAEDVVDKIVAVVNGDIITLFDVDQRLQPTIARMKAQQRGAVSPEIVDNLRGQMLDRLINNALLHQEAERFNISISDVELENQILSVRSQAGVTEDQFIAQLATQGLTLDDYREELRNNILRQRLISVMVKRKVVVTDEEIQKFYQANKDRYSRDKRVGLSLIVLPESEDAGKLLQRLELGLETFADAARRLSVGPGADNGGDIGELSWDDLAPEWRAAVEGLSVGEVSEPFTLQGSVALLRLNGMESGETLPLEEVEQEIYQELSAPLLEERYKEYMAKLKAKSVIERMM